MDKKPQYSQDVSSSQLDLQIQCNPIQNSSKSSHEYSQTDSTASMGTQMTQITTTKPKNKVGGLSLRDLRFTVK